MLNLGPPPFFSLGVSKSDLEIIYINLFWQPISYKHCIVRSRTSCLAWFFGLKPTYKPFSSSIYYAEHAADYWKIVCWNVAITVYVFSQLRWFFWERDGFTEGSDTGPSFISCQASLAAVSYVEKSHVQLFLTGCIPWVVRRMVNCCNSRKKHHRVGFIYTAIVLLQWSKAAKLSILFP